MMKKGGGEGDERIERMKEMAFGSDANLSISQFQTRMDKAIEIESD